MQEPSHQQPITGSPSWPMVQTDLPETRLVHKFKENNEPLTWSEVLDRLLPQRPIGSEEEPYSKAGVELWRKLSDDNDIIWYKMYLGNHELSVFNKWEADFLANLSDLKIENTYRAKKTVRHGTHLSRKLYIETYHAGPTLADWLRIRVQVGQNIFAHALCFPVNYLTLTLWLLRALEGVHAQNLVHCDLHPGNICIPVTIMQPPKDNGDATSSLAFQLKFAELTLIDFGFSVDRQRNPPATLPLGYDESAPVSHHLKEVLAAIKSETMGKLKDAGDARPWQQVKLDQHFWQGQIPSPLDKLKSIDWREDLYRLGKMLAAIRDGVLPFYNNNGNEGRIIRRAETPAVEELIANLPEELMSWGDQKQVGTETPQLLHRKYIKRIDDALVQAHQRGETEEARFITRAVDFKYIQLPDRQPDPVKMPVLQPSAPETYINLPDGNPQPGRLQPPRGMDTLEMQIASQQRRADLERAKLDREAAEKLVERTKADEARLQQEKEKLAREKATKDAAEKLELERTEAAEAKLQQERENLAREKAAHDAAEKLELERTKAAEAKLQQEKEKLIREKMARVSAEKMELERAKAAEAKRQQEKEKLAREKVARDAAEKAERNAALIRIKEEERKASERRRVAQDAEKAELAREKAARDAAEKIHAQKKVESLAREAKEKKLVQNPQVSRWEVTVNPVNRLQMLIGVFAILGFTLVFLHLIIVMIGHLPAYAEMSYRTLSGKVHDLNKMNPVQIKDSANIKEIVFLRDGTGGLAYSQNKDKDSPTESVSAFDGNSWQFETIQNFSAKSRVIGFNSTMIDDRIHLSPDGRRFSHVDGNYLEIWDSATASKPIIIRYNNAIGNVDFSSDGTFIAVSTKDNVYHILNAATGIQKLENHLDINTAIIGFSPQIMVLRDYSDNKITFVDVNSDVSVSAQFLNLDVLSGLWQDFSFSEASNQLAFFSREKNYVHIISADSKKENQDINVNINVNTWRTGLSHYMPFFKNRTSSIALSPDGHVLVTLIEKEDPLLWDTETGRLIAVLPSSAPVETKFTFSPDSKFLALHEFSSNAARIYDTKTGSLIYSVKPGAEHLRFRPGNPLELLYKLSLLDMNSVLLE